MKTYRKRFIQIATIAMVLVLASSFICGCLSTPEENSPSGTSGVTVTDITDKVKSLSDAFALTDDSYSTFDANDPCWVIVSFNDASILDSAMRFDSDNIYNYINSEAALKQASDINNAQNKFARKYSSIIQETSFRYNALLNGMAVKVRYGDISKLEKDPSVDSVIVCESYLAPEAVTQNEVSVYGTGIYDPGDVGYDGTGTVVAVLDTGLDYTHTAFAEQPTGTLAIDIDNVRGLLSSLAATEMSIAADRELKAEDLYVSDKVPYAFDYADVDADVYPTSDHGTHVAGIIAGHDDVITGIATNAQLAIMKVFPDVDEGARTDSILAALNDCVVLGVDAINMSLGSSCGFAREEDDDAVNEIYDAIRQVGICLICAASNDYASSFQSENGDTSLATNPDYGTVGSPSSYEAAMSVASISGVKTPYLMVNNEQEVYYTEVGNTGSTKRYFATELLKGKTSATFEYAVVPGLGTESNYYDLDVEGKIAVVKRGSINFEEKVNTATSHGAVGVIVYNNVSGTISMSVGKSKTPACSVSMDMGKYFEAHPTGTLEVNVDYAAGPFMSDFSSWGPLPNLEFKPDITAHGGDILSSVRGGYDHLSGTSMAAPNMTGATVLVRQYVKERFPELSAYEVTELTYQLLMSTATIAYNEDGNPYSPRKQGAGLADIGKSVSTSAYLYVDGTNKPKLTLGDDPDRTGVYTMSFKVRNLGSIAQSYTINPIVMTEAMSSDNKTVAQKAYMLNDTGYTVDVNGTGAALGSNNTLLLAGYATAEVSITITLSGDAKAYLDSTFVNGTYVEGYIELLSQNQDVDLNIGFLGFYGDWSVAPMLDVTAYQVGEEKEDPSILEEDKLKADIYATLPMSGFRYQISDTDYEEGYYGMGQFGYKIADGYTEPAIIEDKASLTMNMDGSYSIYIIAAGLLRNAKTVRMQITDAITGELIWEGVDYNARKSYYSGGRMAGAVSVDFKVNDYNLTNNSRYTFSMECELDWNSTENNLNNTFSFDFYIDNEAPIVVKEQTQVRVESTNGRKSYYLDLYVYDNHYIQGYQLGTFKSITTDGNMVGSTAFHNNVIPMTDAKRNTVSRITYDITQYWSDIQANDGNIYVELIDYAKNNAVFQLQLPSSSAEEIGFRSTMRAVNTYVNEVVDLTDYIVTTPSDLWVKDIKWSVDDETVAVVRDGVVLGVGVGTTTLRVSNQDGTAEAELPVTVREARSENINVTQIQLNKTRVTVERGEEFTLNASLVPHDLFADLDLAQLADVNLVWSTAGGIAQFVTYDENGNEVLTNSVKGVNSVTVRTSRSGSATISVVAEGSTSRVSSSCSVYIKSEYEVEGAILMSYTGRGDENGVVEIPDDLGIVYIYMYAFLGNPYITEIIVPDGVIEIYEAAIYGCDNLRKVVLPESCKTLGKWGLAWNPSLEEVDLGGVNTIGQMAFIMDESLSKIDFSGVYSVGPYAFAYCDSLNVLDISSVKSMGYGAFVFCQGLTELKTGPFTPIGDVAFAGCTGLTEIELNGGVIGEYAFGECYNLQSVTINNAVDTIGNSAFYGCVSLKEINYRSTVRVIDNYAFANCISLETVTIPNGVEHIGAMAFAMDSENNMGESNLREVIVSSGAKVNSIGAGVFYGCDKLATFTVAEDNAYLSSCDGILYDKSQRKVVLVPEGYESDTVVLPDTVREIGAYAFSGSSITSVTGQNVTKIDDFAFYISDISEVNFNDKLSYIGEAAFYGTTNFHEWPSCFNNVTYIGDSAFFVGYNVDSVSGLQGTLILPETLTYLGAYAFANNDITELIVDSKLKEIGEYTFAQCVNLEYVTLNNSIEKLGEGAFAYCTSLRNFDMPDSVTTVAYGLFMFDTQLSNVKLSENLTEISEAMFLGCTSLTSIELPESVKVIGDAAFVNVDSQTFQYMYAPIANINLDNVEHIGDAAFVGSSLTSINAPKLISVGAQAFMASEYLTELYAPELLTIGDDAFDSCTMLYTLDISKVEEIGAYAFYYCLSLTDVNLPNVKTLGVLAFFYATSLRNVNFEQLETIGTAAFMSTNITSLHLPATLKNIEIQGLYGAERLREVTIDEDCELYFTDAQGVVYKRLPNGMLTLVYFPTAKYLTRYIADEMTIKVEAYAFAYNESLITVTLPERLQVLGAGAFYGCSGLKTIELRSAAAPILEMYYSEDAGGIDNHYYDIFQTDAESTVNTVTIIYPSNGSGYDAYNWQLYLKGNVKAEGAIARTSTTIDIMDTLAALDVNSLTLDDIAQVVLLRRIYASLSNDQKSFITANLVNTLTEAEETIAQLIVEQIAKLPSNVTEANRAEVERIRALLNQCNSDITSKVTNVSKLTAAEAKLAGNSGEPGDPSDNNLGLILGLSIGGGVLVLAAAAVVTLWLLKRKKAQATQSTEEDTDNEEK